MCDGTRGCACRRVVTRVYRELRERRIPEVSAFDTATTIFRLHHPEVGLPDARDTIAAWLDDHA